MRVQEIMTPSVRTCDRSATLAEAAMIMWHSDCGIVPVVEPGGKTVGVITDRDICMAAATRTLGVGEIRVGDVMTGQLFTCRPEDSIRKALQSMAHHKVRRLAVVDGEGRLAGILSINDLVLHAGKDLPATAIVDTLRSICSYQRPEAGPDPPEDLWPPESLTY